jgi:lipid-binding SYLF domain-containing protein
MAYQMVRSRATRLTVMSTNRLVRRFICSRPYGKPSNAFASARAGTTPAEARSRRLRDTASGTGNASLAPMAPSTSGSPRFPKIPRVAGVLGLLATVAFAPACSSANGPAPATASAQERKEAVERLDSATRLVPEFRSKVPDDVARNARCVVVIPALVQGGLIVGGRGGRGLANCLKKGGDWSQPAPISVSGGTFGAQIGVQKVDVLMLVMNDEAKNALLSGHFQIGVDASAAAGPVGTGTSADFKLGSGVLSYARSEGLFAGATLSGASVARDDDATLALYGGLPELRSLLQGPMPSPGASADRMVAAVRDAFGPPKAPAAAFETRPSHGPRATFTE